jgi:hypothetical protein
MPLAVVQADAEVDSTRDKAHDRGDDPLPTLRRGDAGHHADELVCVVLGVSGLSGAGDAEAWRMLCVLLVCVGPLPAAAGIVRVEPGMPRFCSHRRPD